MNHTLQESDNLFAEVFLRTVGALSSFQDVVHDSQQAGILQVREILTGLGNSIN